MQLRKKKKLTNLGSSYRRRLKKILASEKSYADSVSTVVVIIFKVTRKTPCGPREESFYDQKETIVEIRLEDYDGQMCSFFLAILSSRIFFFLFVCVLFYHRRGK